jgi:hypothetical protein
VLAHASSNDLMSKVVTRELRSLIILDLDPKSCERLLPSQGAGDADCAGRNIVMNHYVVKCGVKVQGARFAKGEMYELVDLSCLMVAVVV